MDKNLWKKTTFWCDYRHALSEMTVHDPSSSSPLKSMFYSCPHYYPENRSEDEDRACPNHLSFEDAEKILDKLSEKVNSDIENNIYRDYKNMQFTVKTYEIKVMKYSTEEVKLKILNKKALR